MNHRKVAGMVLATFRFFGYQERNRKMEQQNVDYVAMTESDWEALHKRPSFVEAKKLLATAYCRLAHDIPADAVVQFADLATTMGDNVDESPVRSLFKGGHGGHDLRFLVGVQTAMGAMLYMAIVQQVINIDPGAVMLVSDANARLAREILLYQQEKRVASGGAVS
jgi:hypothetical protein